MSAVPTTGASSAGLPAPVKLHQPLTRQQSLEKLKALLEMEVSMMSTINHLTWVPSKHVLLLLLLEHYLENLDP